MDLAILRSKLKVGDQKNIVEITGLSPRFVEYVLKGLRNAETEKGQKVVEVAKSLIEQRERLANQYKQP